MTLPALIADHREKQTVNQVLAFYSKLSQATQYIINEEGDPSVWLREGISQEVNSELLSKKYKKYLKVLTDCTKISDFCIAPKYKLCFAEQEVVFVGGSNRASRYNFVLQDGSSVSFHVYNTFSTHQSNRNKKKYGVIYYDTNGIKLPNRFGHDMFQFELTDDGLYSYSENEFKQYVEREGYNNSYWLMTHKNLDYLHCPDELKAGALGCKKKKK